MVHGLGFSCIDKCTLPIGRRYIPNTSLDLGFGLRIFLNPGLNFLIAALVVFTALHFREHQLTDEFVLGELLVVLREFGVFCDELIQLGIDLRVSAQG